MRIQLRQQGFTLLEILLAVFIFALIILGAQQIFSMAVKNSESLQAQQERLRAIALSLNHLEKDFIQLTPRTLRDPDGITEIQPLQTDINDNYLFRLTRAGWKNPLYRQRSELQAVMYRLEDDKLIRTHSLHLDPTTNIDLVERTILDKVSNFDVKFLMRNGDWSDGWPLRSTDIPQSSNEEDPLPASPELPLAIEIQLELEDLGTVRRMFNLSPVA